MTIPSSIPTTSSAEVYACLYAREFPAQALLRLRTELRPQPCVVMQGDPPLQSVCSLNLKARSAGARHGMTPVEIETIPAVTALTRSRAEEAAAKAALLELAGAFSPRVEDHTQGDHTQADAFACVIDIAGTEKLFGPPALLGKKLFERTRALGITASIAVSSNVHAAICLAKGMSLKSPLIVVPAGQQGDALAALSLNVLYLSLEKAETFTSWGIRTLGMLAELPEKELIARMGQEGSRLQQLARGALPHLFQPSEPAFTLEERMELDSPVELLESLLFVTGAMLEQLIVRATSRVLALASVTIALALEGGGSHRRTVRPALPTNDRQVWIKLLHLDLEAHPPNSVILALTLTAEPGTTSKVQLGLFSPQLPEPARLEVTLARIAKIVGEENAGQAVLLDSHRPEAFRMERFTVKDTDAAATSTKRSQSPAQPQPNTQANARSAIRLLRPAENISVTLREDRPQSFFFRQQRYFVERAYGPWLAGGDWWSPTLWGHEQWDLVTRADDPNPQGPIPQAPVPQATVLCCCVLRDLMLNHWQMTGLYD